MVIFLKMQNINHAKEKQSFIEGKIAELESSHCPS